MIFIFNRSYEKDKRVIRALQDIYGIGFNKALHLCLKCGLNSQSELGDLNDSVLRLLINEIKKIGDIDQELKKIIINNLNKKSSINCYQGIRYNLGLPVRGQRTHTNSKTVKRRIKNNLE